MLAPWPSGMLLCVLAGGCLIPSLAWLSAEAAFTHSARSWRAALVALAWWLLHCAAFAALLYAPIGALKQGAGLLAALALSLVLGAAPLLFRRSHAWLRGVLQDLDPGSDWRTAWAGWRARQWLHGDPADHFWQRSYLSHLLLLCWLAGCLSLLLWPELGARWHVRLGASALLMALIMFLVDRLLAPSPAAEVDAEIADYFGVLPVQSDDSATLDPDQDLILAVRAADDVLVERLLKLGANANAEPAFDALDRRSALVSAATCGQLVILRRLIAAGADINRSNGGSNALLAATKDSYEGRPDVVLMLLSNGADPGCVDPEGATPLHHASRSRDPAVVQHLLDRKANANALDRRGWSAAAWAAQAQHLDVLDALLRAGASLEPEAGVPLLVAAAEAHADHPAITQRLLRGKAQVLSTDPQGRSALHVAASLDHAHICEALLDAGAALEAVDQLGRTPWLCAADKAARRVLARLLFRGAQAGVCDAQGADALHLAVQAEDSDVELIHLLLGSGVDPEQTNAKGQTSLDLALQLNRFDLARALSDSHELPDAVAELGVVESNRGLLIAEALRQGKRDVAEKLLELGPIGSEPWPELLTLAAAILDTALLNRFVANGLDLKTPLAVLALSALRPLPMSALELLLARAAGVGSDPLRARSPLLLLAGVDAPLPEAQLDYVDALLARMLQLGADPDARDHHGVPLLHHALKQWPVLALARLIDVVKFPNASGLDGRSALHHLVQQQRPDAEFLLRALILAGTDPGQPAGDGSTPLGLAIQHGRSEHYLLLDWPEAAHPGRRLIPDDVSEACKRGDLRTLDLLLLLGLAVDARDARGASGALHAAGRGDIDVLMRLLDAGARLELAADSGMAPLGAATVARQHAVIRWLLEQGLALDSAQAQGFTPLSLAAMAGDLETCELLLDSGAGVDAGLPERRPALMALRALLQDARSDSPYQYVLQRLLEAGADCNMVDEESRTLVLLLCGAQQTNPPMADETRLNELLVLLHAHGAEMNIPDRMGRTAVHWACRHGQLQAFAQLLRMGADPKLPDDLRKLPVDLAQARNRSEVTALIEEHQRPS